MSTIFMKDFEKSKQYTPGDKAVGAEKGVTASFGTLSTSEHEPEQLEGLDREHIADVPVQSKEQENPGTSFRSFCS